MYVLQSQKSGQWYTGSAGNLRKRLSQHNLGQSSWIKKGVPWKLIYYEACLDATDASVREKFLKSGPGKSFLKKRLKRFLSLKG